MGTHGVDGRNKNIEARVLKNPHKTPQRESGQDITTGGTPSKKANEDFFAVKNPGNIFKEEPKGNELSLPGSLRPLQQIKEDLYDPKKPGLTRPGWSFNRDGVGRSINYNTRIAYNPVNNQARFEKTNSVQSNLARGAQLQYRLSLIVGNDKNSLLKKFNTAPIEGSNFHITFEADL
jgi:hypothetical protein